MGTILSSEIGDSIYNIIYVGLSLVLVGIIIYYIIWKIRHKKNTKNLWVERRTLVENNQKHFYDELQQRGIKKELKIKTGLLYQTDEPIENFNFIVDYNKKMVAVASFDEKPYRSTILRFDEIKSYEILDGQITSSSFGTTSGAIVGGSVAAGMASTETQKEDVIQNIRLKLETTDPYKPGIIIPIQVYGMDTTSTSYKNTLIAIENIKSVLNKIIGMSK